MTIHEKEVQEIVHDYVRDKLSSSDAVSGVESLPDLIDEVSDMVGGFSVGKDVRYWKISEDDESSPEEVTDGLTMRLAAELVREKKVLTKYPKFKFSHHPDTKKMNKVGIEFEYRPIQ